jgi:hypothetical protein
MIVPRFTQDRCLILTDSGVESLLACAMASEQAQLSGNEQSMLLPGWWETTEETDLMISAVEPAVLQHAATYGLGVSPDRSVFPPEDQHNISPSQVGPLQSNILLQAAQLAIQSKIRRVIWPIRIAQPGIANPPSALVDPIATAIDRAVLASRLASLDASQLTAVDVVIETPFVDLSNDQMRDLVYDMSLPIETCWWHNNQSIDEAQVHDQYWTTATHKSSAQVELKNPQHSQT